MGLMAPHGGVIYLPAFQATNTRQEDDRQAWTVKSQQINSQGISIIPVKRFCVNGTPPTGMFGLSSGERVTCT
jgi:hypothetical protein